MASPAEQESGADWRTVELHALESTALHGGLLRQLSADCRMAAILTDGEMRNVRS